MEYPCHLRAAEEHNRERALDAPAQSVVGAGLGDGIAKGTEDEVHCSSEDERGQGEPERLCQAEYHHAGAPAYGRSNEPHAWAASTGEDARSQAYGENTDRISGIQQAQGRSAVFRGGEGAHSHLGEQAVGHAEEHRARSTPSTATSTGCAAR